MLSLKRAAAYMPVAVMAMTMLTAGDGMAQAPQKVVIRDLFPSQTSVTWINDVAKDEGFYAKENLEVEHIVTNPLQIVSAVISDSAEIGWANATQFVTASEKGTDLVAFGLSNFRPPYKLISVPSVKTVKDLKGKHIALSSETDVYNYVVRDIVRKGGLDPDKDIQWIIGTNSAARLAAISTGNIDAGLFSPPADSRLLKQGYNELAFTPDFFPNLTLSVEVARRSWLEKNEDAVRRYQRANAAAAKYMLDPKNRNRVVEILMKHTASSKADAEDAYDYFSKSGEWVDTCINKAGLVNVIKIMGEMKQLTKFTVADADKLVTDKYCAR
jgi:NitT/TauT family transport system substrate-binding protein